MVGIWLEGQSRDGPHSAPVIAKDSRVQGFRGFPGPFPMLPFHLPRPATLTGCLCNLPRRDSIHGVDTRCHKEGSGPGIRKDKKGTAIVDGFASSL